MRVVWFLLDLSQVCWREQTGLEPLEGSWQLTSPLGTVLEVFLSGISWVGRTLSSESPWVILRLTGSAVRIRLLNT